MYSLSDGKLELLLSRSLFENDSQTTGGDYCGKLVDDIERVSIGVLDGSEIFRVSNKSVYAAYREDLLCTELPIFKRLSKFDSARIVYRFLDDSMSNEEKDAYLKLVDQIVLSLKDIKE